MFRNGDVIKLQPGNSGLPLGGVIIGTISPTLHYVIKEHHTDKYFYVAQRDAEILYEADPQVIAVDTYHKLRIAYRTEFKNKFGALDVDEVHDAWVTKHAEDAVKDIAQAFEDRGFEVDLHDRYAERNTGSKIEDGLRDAIEGNFKITGQSVLEGQRAGGQKAMDEITGQKIGKRPGTQPIKTTEREDAIRLAHKLLDEPNADPDDDLRLLSRQFLRAIGEI